MGSFPCFHRDRVPPEGQERIPAWKGRRMGSAGWQSPGCEKTFITVSALFSHNRAHFREQELFSCSFPGCSKQYDKACRLKIHLRSHTGERPFICDSDSCGWTFTSMSKLLRHRRKHDDDRRFTCPVEGCGKSFTRAEHLKGHSITHLGTKPFECPVEGCCARFSARSSLYIHSKKHVQDVGAPKSRCPVSTCNRLFTSKHSMKAHMVRQHSRRQGLHFPRPPWGAASLQETGIVPVPSVPSSPLGRHRAVGLWPWLPSQVASFALSLPLSCF